MFLGHIAVGLAGRSVTPRVSLATWLTSVQLVDLIWPIMLLAGVEHVRIAPGITAFTPLDFYDYPVTHSLVAGLGWAAAFGAVWMLVRRRAPERGPGGGPRVAVLLGLGVLSHWVLDVFSHRPDVPVLPHGPYLGLGLWYSVPATLAVELSLFAAGVLLYVRSRRTRAGAPFWALMAFLLVAYFAAAFGPPPPDVRALAVAGLAAWLLLPWAWYADRSRERAT